MGRDEKHLSWLLSLQPFRPSTRFDGCSVELDLCLLVLPGGGHPFTEDGIEQIFGTFDIMSSLLERPEDLCLVEGDLEPLKDKTFSGSLWADQHCKIAELYVGGLDLRKIPDLE